MNLKKYFEEKANYVYGARLLKFAVVVLLVVTVINIIIAIMAMQKQKVVVIPPSLSTQTFISASDASDEYLTAMARYIAALSISYNPAVARAQFNSFLQLVHPSVFPSYKSAFYALAEKIEAGKVSSAYYITSIKVDRKNNSITLTGLLNQWTQDQQFITNETRQYLIRYKISDGLFQILELKEYKGVE